MRSAALRLLENDPPTLLRSRHGFPRIGWTRMRSAALAPRLFDRASSDVDRLMPVYENAGILTRYSCVPIDWYLCPMAGASATQLYLENAANLLWRSRRASAGRSGPHGRATSPRWLLPPPPALRRQASTPSSSTGSDFPRTRCGFRSSAWAAPAAWSASATRRHSPAGWSMATCCFSRSSSVPSPSATAICRAATSSPAPCSATGRRRR